MRRVVAGDVSTGRPVPRHRYSISCSSGQPALRVSVGGVTPAVPGAVVYNTMSRISSTVISVPGNIVSVLLSRTKNVCPPTHSR